MKQKKTKRTYRLRNWKQYNKALVGRGRLTLWVSAETTANWNNTARTGTRGKPATDTDTVILWMASLQEIYPLPLRATEGLLASVIRLLGVGWSVPDYTTLCRWRKVLEVSLGMPESYAA